MRVTLEIPSLAVWNQLSGLLPFLNIQVVAQDTVQENSATQTHKALEIMQLLAKRGAVDATIADPVEWQRETRKDRSLDF